MCRQTEVLPPPERFEEARRQGLAALEQREGIGTLKERSLHAVLKYWFAPDDACHERKVGRYVADVFDGERIVEIQTGSAYRLQPKLEAFLPAYPVTVVLPLVRRKTLTRRPGRPPGREDPRRWDGPAMPCRSCTRCWRGWSIRTLPLHW